MSNSLTLLAQPYSVAARSIIQQALKPDVNIDFLEVGQSEIRSDGDVDMAVFVSGDAYDDPSWPYRGSVSLRHKRVDLHEAFGHLGLRFYAGAEYRSQDVVTFLGDVLQIHFDSTDFIHESFALTTASRTVTLRASANSLRWKGQVDIFIYR
jgi:hypothetical protein